MQHATHLLTKAVLAHSDFKHLTTQHLGLLKLTDNPHFEALQEPVEQEEGEFYLDQDQPEANNIKTQQFNSSIIMPTTHAKPTDQHPKIALTIEKTYGFNSYGKNTVIFLDPYTHCIALGCMLIINRKWYLKHQYPISTMAYDPQSQRILTGSEGHSPEVVLWKWNSQQSSIEFLGKMRQPRKSKGVSMLCFMGERVISIGQDKLHGPNYAYLFDLQKKQRISIAKIPGKTISLQAQKGDNSNSCYILCENGLQFAYDATKLKISNLIPGKAFTCMHFSKQAIYLGTRHGEICCYTLKHEQLKSAQLHKGWIHCMQGQCLQGKEYLITAGVDDLCLRLSLVQPDRTLSPYKSVKVDHYVRSLSVINTIALLGCRDGSIFKIQSDKLIASSKRAQYMQIVQQGINSSGDTNSNKYCNHFMYDRHSSSLLIANNQVNQVRFLSESQFKVKKLNKLPQKLYCSGDQIAYSSQSPLLNNYSKSIKQIVSQSFAGKFLEESDQITIQNRFESSILMKEKIPGEQSPKSASCLKYSPSGGKIAIGTISGQLLLLSCNKSDYQFSSFAKQQHTYLIESINWSKDENYIRTISRGELFYWKVAIENEQLSLHKVKPRIAKDVEWVDVDKFSWECKQLWEEISYIAQVSNVTRLGGEGEGINILAVALDNGSLRIYNNPVRKGKFTEFKLFGCAFQLCAAKNLLALNWKDTIVIFGMKAE